MGVQLIRGLERGRGAPRAGEREKDRLEDLVAAVGHEHHRGVDTVERRDGAPKIGGGPIGIAIPVHVRHGARQCVFELGGRADRSFVGVEAHPDVDLRRVIALEGLQVVANGEARHAMRLPTRPNGSK